MAVPLVFQVRYLKCMWKSNGRIEFRGNKYTCTQTELAAINSKRKIV